MAARVRRNRELLDIQHRRGGRESNKKSDEEAWKAVDEGRLSVAQRVRRKRAIATLRTFESTARRQFAVAACLMLFALTIAVLVNQHLGKSRGGIRYTERVTTYQYANATRCIPVETCPYAKESDSFRARYLYRDPNTKLYVRIQIDNPDEVPEDLVRVELPVFIDPCDVNMDEILLTVACVAFVHSCALPILARDNLRKVKEFKPFLYEKDISRTPDMVFRVQEIVSGTSIAYLVCFLLLFFTISTSKTCQVNVPDLYFLGIGVAGLITATACVGIVVSARAKAQSMDYRWAYFALSGITLVQILPLGQLVWHLNHTACIIRDPPFLEYAPLCQLGVLASLFFTCIGVYGVVAIHLVSAKVKPKALRLYRTLSILSFLLNVGAAGIFLVAVSGFYSQDYLQVTSEYCEYDPAKAGKKQESGCLTSGELPWGWFNNCYKNTTAEPYTAMDQLFSCRLCSETNTCLNSEPSDTYDLNTRRTTVAALAYFGCTLICAFGGLFSHYMAQMMADDLRVKRETAHNKMKLALTRTEGVQIQDIVIRSIKHKPPSWNEAVEAAYFKRHYPTRPDSDNWRVRIKRMPEWKEMIALYGQRDVQKEGEKVLAEYMAECLTLKQEAIEILNIDAYRIAAEASDGEDELEAARKGGVLSDLDDSDEDETKEETKEEVRGGGRSVSTATSATSSSTGKSSSSGGSDSSDDDEAIFGGTEAGAEAAGTQISAQGVLQF